MSKEVLACLKYSLALPALRFPLDPFKGQAGRKGDMGDTPGKKTKDVSPVIEGKVSGC
jgi:hypothetical protein